MFEQSPILYQAINSSNASMRRKSALMGSFEDILIKCGYPLYRIIPNLPSKNASIFHETRRFMTIGINVTGNTSPTVAMMACINDPYDPSLEHYSFHGTLLPPRKDVIGIEKMQKLAEYGILEGLRKHFDLYNQLPEYLVVMRSGVATGQVAFVQSKEIGMTICIDIVHPLRLKNVYLYIAGIKRAIYRITRDKKNQKEFGKSLKKWTPDYFVVMVNKRISEKVYMAYHNGHYQTPNRPIILQQAITSDHIWDSILYIGGGTKAERKWNPTKLSVIEYPPKGRVPEGEFKNLVQMIHALHYGFGFSV